MAIVEAGDFKGNKMIVLKTRPDSEYPFQFGQKKAQLIVECFAEIKRFAETGEVGTAPPPAPPAAAPASDEDIPF